MIFQIFYWEVWIVLASLCLPPLNLKWLISKIQNIFALKNMEPLKTFLYLTFKHPLLESRAITRKSIKTVNYLFYFLKVKVMNTKTFS